MRAFLLVVIAVVCAAVLSPSVASGQFPGSVRVEVLDAITGTSVPSAEVTTDRHPASFLTGQDGVWVLTSVSAGRHTLSVRAFGYHPQVRSVTVTDGSVNRITIRLDPRAIELPEIHAFLIRGGSGIRLSAEEIDRSGAHSVSDLLRRIPGVLVSSRSRSSAETVSIRGSSVDAVLVLVDGVPLNDPMTGEADLSLIPMSALSAVEVLPGAQSTRYGVGAPSSKCATYSHIYAAHSRSTMGNNATSTWCKFDHTPHWRFAGYRIK